MTRIAMPMLVLALLATAPARLSAQTVDAITRTFPVPMDRAWVVAESVLKGLGWDIDKSDRAVGWILTDSRGLDFKDYAVYGQGTRHKLRLILRAQGEGRTTVTVEREVYREERILWMTERKSVAVTDHTVEIAVLDAIARSL